MFFHGNRPLVLGQRDGPNGPEWCVASEDCAFGPIGYRRVCDVRPGEMIIISPEVVIAAIPCSSEYPAHYLPTCLPAYLPTYQLTVGACLLACCQVSQAVGSTWGRCTAALLYPR